MRKKGVGRWDPSLLKHFFTVHAYVFFCFVFSPFVRTLALAAECKQEALSHLGWLSSHHQVGSFSHLGPFICHRQSFLHPKLYFEASSRKFKIAELGGKNKSFVQHVQFELCEEALLLPFHCPLLWRNHFFFFNEVRRTLSQKAVHSWVSWTDGRLKHTTKGLLWCCQFSFMKSFWYKLEKALCSVKDFFLPGVFAKVNVSIIGGKYTLPLVADNTFSFTERPMDLRSQCPSVIYIHLTNMYWVPIMCQAVH